MFRLLTLSLFCALSANVFAADTYKFDTAHSSILFSLSHNTVGMAHGRFNAYEGTADFDGDTLKAVSVTIDAGSIDTANAKRDEHLRKSDFFNAVEFPKVTFKSTKVEKTAAGYSVSGDFTMMGVTKPVTFTLTTKGPVDGRDGAKIRGVHGSAVIKRSDWGMSYGSPGIGDEVTVVVSLEVVK